VKHPEKSPANYSRCTANKINHENTKTKNNSLRGKAHSRPVECHRHDRGKSQHEPRGTNSLLPAEFWVSAIG